MSVPVFIEIEQSEQVIYNFNVRSKRLKYIREYDSSLAY